MPARVPLDVDLEDKLIYGLTPTRFAYIVVAMLLSFAIWSSTWAPGPVRAAFAAGCFGAGAVVSWGRWKGRAADSWAVDLVCFVIRNHRLIWNRAWLGSLTRIPGNRPQPPETNQEDLDSLAA